jgi:lactate dehydrogenase-like 2-hydroxyacid dehydrogenase
VTGGHIGISNDLMSRLPRLDIVAINGVGYDKVDLDYARGRGIRVSFTPGVLTEDVSDLAVGLALSVLRGIAFGDRFIRSGRWLKGDMPLARKFTGRRFGIFGMGAIGRAIAAKLAPFGSVSYCARARKNLPYAFCESALSLARACDVLVIAASATAETRNIIGREVLDALGVDGYLINVSRGSMIDEGELIAALSAGKIAGAGLDVFASEPQVPLALLHLDNVLLTPHIASATMETRRNMGRIVLANLQACFAGEQLPSALV